MLSKKIIFAIVFLSLGLTTVLSAQCNSHKKARKASYHHKKAVSIVDIAVGSKQHTTLVAALKAGDLVGALSGEGPFTVFAPTNAAFDKLPDGTVSGLLEPDNKSALQAVLKYHVVAGNFTASDVLTAINRADGLFKIKTLAGDTLEAFTKNDNVYIRDAKDRVAQVTAYDLSGTNGVIHIVDEVLLP